MKLRHALAFVILPIVVVIATALPSRSTIEMCEVEGKSSAASRPHAALRASAGGSPGAAHQRRQCQRHP